MKKYILFLSIIILVILFLPSVALADSQKPYDCQILEDYTWNITQIGADQVHLGGNTGQGVKVAVIDTGIDYTHPELAGIYAGGYDFVNNDDDPMDDHGHGTHCAGILAAAINGEGVIGVAPDVELYALKVLNSSGNGYWSDIVLAVQWCVDNEIQITSNSYGGSGYNADLETAFNNAYYSGVLSIAAAGNSGGGENYDRVLYPAKLSSVVAVAATDSSDNRAYFSSTGPTVEVSAPGVNIYSSIPGGYGYKQGTSMACPHVVGEAAQVEYAHPDWDNITVRGQIRASATDLGKEGHDWLCGFGLVNAVVACGELIPNPPEMPGNEPPPPPPPPEKIITKNLSMWVDKQLKFSCEVNGQATVIVEFTSPRSKIWVKSDTTDPQGNIEIKVKGHPRSGLWKAKIISVSGDWDKENSEIYKEILV